MATTLVPPLNNGALGNNPVDSSSVKQAQQRLGAYLDATPLHYSERFQCWLKLENLQRTGSYKVRGALNALLAAEERGDMRPIIAASAGNYAQGLAWAGRERQRQIFTVMPENAPQTKVRGVAALGGTVVMHGENYDAAKAHALKLAQDNNYIALSAFDDPDVIAGQGTVGLELTQLEADTVFVPVGGGGLASGIALALQHTSTKVVGVQVEGVDGMARVLRGQKPPAQPALTLADGTRVKEPGKLTRRILGDLLDDLIVVREDDVRATVVRLALEENIIAEGAGVLALTASQKVQGGCKCAVISGGNIDSDVLGRLLSEWQGLAKVA